MNKVNYLVSLSLPFLIILIISIFFAHVNVFAMVSPVTKPIISFCAGYYHACAVFDTYKMKCWGYSFNTGQALDYGYSTSTIGDNIPYFNPGINLAIVKVTCRNNGLCIFLSTGIIKCAGGNNMGQTGIGVSDSNVGAPKYVGDTLPVVNLGADVVVTDIVGGQYHSCVLTTGGKVKCFGWNTVGQLGLGNTDSKGKSSSDMGENLAYVSLGAGIEVASVHSGPSADFNCVILSKPTANVQRIKCWGNNFYHQLGYGDDNNRGDNGGEMGDNLLLVDLGTESRVKHLVLGSSHSCALLVNDILKCFGFAFYGQAASGSSTKINLTGNLLPSVLIDSGKAIQLMSAGSWHTCIVYDDTLTMKCAGHNVYGQLGQSDTTNRGNAPETLFPNIATINLGTGSLKIQSIHSGWYFNCVVFVDSSVKCFGDNMFGQAAIGKISTPLETIGNDPNEMGNNLAYAVLFSPTKSPTKSPTTSPTKNPTNPTLLPSISPTRVPTNLPSISPSYPPTLTPTNAPTIAPTHSPSYLPSTIPTGSPSQSPSSSPTITPTSKPSTSPTSPPSFKPSHTPSNKPSKSPTISATQTPTIKPTTNPSRSPSIAPSTKPSSTPFLLQTKNPTSSPTGKCNYQNAKLCQFDLKCNWVKTPSGTKQCVLYDCTKLNKNKCGKQKSRCKWNKETSLCELKIN